MSIHTEHPFFNLVKIEEINISNFESKLEQASNQLVGIFFWGHNCPNCEVAKGRLAEEAKAMNELGFTWFHVNTYENFELGTRFGLHGIPTFIFFYKGKKLGRISPFPGIDPFFEALTKLKQNTTGI